MINDNKILDSKNEFLQLFVWDWRRREMSCGLSTVYESVWRMNWRRQRRWKSTFIRQKKGSASVRPVTWSFVENSQAFEKNWCRTVMSLCRADDTCSSNLGADLNVCVDTRLDMIAQRNIYTRLTSRLKVSLGMQSEVCINCSKQIYKWPESICDKDDSSQGCCDTSI